MKGALISYAGRNWADLPDTEVTFASGDQVPVEGYPLSELQSRQLSRTARWTGPGLPGFVALRVLFPVRMPVVVVGLLGLNFREANHIANMTVNARIGATWYEPLITVNNRDGGVRSLPYNLIAVLPLDADGNPQKFNELRIQADWDAFGAEYSEAARLWVGDGILLPEGVDSNWDLDVREGGRLEESKGFQNYEDPGPRLRVLSFSHTDISTRVAYGFNEGDLVTADVPSINDLQLSAGATGEVLVIARTKSPPWVRRTGIYGHLAAVPRLSHISSETYSTTITVVEER